MAFASSLLPAPASGVRASHAPELAFPPVNRKGGVSLRRRGARHGVRAEVNESASALAIDALSQVKHVLLPITDRNPYLSEGTRQAAATTTSLAKKYGANITVVGGFTEFGLMERLGEGKKPTAIIAEVADDLELDLVVLSMEAIHSKQVDGNLLAEFIPCPILMLPL
ncbi:uncharacterized protein [Aegilops tauschii subsp. strangulata]|uniref:UspA domain-containing protein n=1 Tax=Aegilops tauschii subsp. strangulata TaxID=200361 RepID=A0A453LHF7_AEGTS|nr:uncharacterized protein LOC109746610 isoform X4 [Aegilops tauschii subsp. strangulata]XP_044382443.1 uncharacterized protein LOC123104631 isoform X2 [Triticum aestivum]XP_044398542.1 uncharacterized protein LOC123122413 isoform X4 [Triticum aestivum]